MAAQQIEKKFDDDFGGSILGWQQCMGLIKTTVAEAAEDGGDGWQYSR